MLLLLLLFLLLYCLPHPSVTLWRRPSKHARSPPASLLSRSVVHSGNRQFEIIDFCLQKFLSSARPSVRQTDRPTNITCRATAATAATEARPADGKTDFNLSGRSRQRTNDQRRNEIQMNMAHIALFVSRGNIKI